MGILTSSSKHEAGLSDGWLSDGGEGRGDEAATRNDGGSGRRAGVWRYDARCRGAMGVRGCSRDRRDRGLRGGKPRERSGEEEEREDGGDDAQKTEQENRAEQSRAERRAGRRRAALALTGTGAKDVSLGWDAKGRDAMARARQGRL